MTSSTILLACDRSVLLDLMAKTLGEYVHVDGLYGRLSRTIPIRFEAEQTKVSWHFFTRLVSILKNLIHRVLGPRPGRHGGVYRPVQSKSLSCRRPKVRGPPQAFTGWQALFTEAVEIPKCLAVTLMLASLSALHFATAASSMSFFLPRFLPSALARSIPAI